MSKIEGELIMNDRGQYLIAKHLIIAGTILEVKIQNEWISICMEQAHGTFYPVPHVHLEAGFIAKICE